MRKKYWLFYIIIIISLGLTNVFGGKVNAETATVIDLNQQSPFKGRTYEDMVDHYSDALMAGETYNNSSSASYYKVPASTKSPYAQGTLSDDTLLNMQEMTNFMRWLTGSNPLKEKCVNSDVLQAGALVRNFEFNHAVSDSSKPEDMDDDLWNYGKNASHNILAWNYTPGGAITGWMNEGYRLSSGSWGTFGHQTSLIGPTYSSIQFGYAGNIAIGKDAASSNTRLSKFTAFPAPGYNPRDIVNPGTTGWSLYYDTSSYTGTAANVSVIVKNVTKGTTSSRSTSNNTMTFSNGTIHFVQPDDYSGSYYSDTYQIQIDGLTDKSTNKAVTVKYTVIFSDVSLDVDQVVSSVNCDFGNIRIVSSLLTEESLKKAAVVLGDEVTVKGLKGATCRIPVKGDWKLDMENRCFYNSADKSLLPDNIIDRFGKLDRITISYVEASSGYSYGTLAFSPSNVIDGDPLKVSVYRYLTNANKVRVFKILDNGDGTYSGKKCFDSDTFDDVTENGCYFNFNTTADVKNNGEYTAIYYYSGGACLVSSFKTLAVKNRLITSINISEIEKTVDEGEGFQLTTGILPVNATVKTLTWSSDNESVATVDEEGNVTTHSPGKAIITAGATDGSDLSETCEVKVMGRYDTPAAPVSAALKDRTVTLKSVDGCVYKLGDGEWQESATFSKLEPESEYTFYIKKAATEYYYESDTAESTIKTLSHSWNDGVITTDPGCTTKGVKTFTCTLCGDTYTEDVDPLDHDYSSWTQDDIINHKKTCSRCKEVVKEKHNWDAINVIAPTCTEDGYTEYECTVCGAEKNDDYKDMLDHDFSSWTKLDDDQHQRICSRDNVVEKENHDWEVVETVAPTCTEDGYTKYKCKYCEATKTEYDDKLGHDLTNWSISDSENHTRVCTRCDYTESEEHTAADSVEENRIEPKCETDGNYDEVIYCSICGGEISRINRVIEKKEHDFGEPDYIWADDNSTVTANRVCKNDSKHIETETVVADYEVIDEPDYENDGLGKYTATFENEAFIKQEKEVVLAKLIPEPTVTATPEPTATVTPESTATPGPTGSPSFNPDVTPTISPDYTVINPDSSEVTPTPASGGRFVYDPSTGKWIYQTVDSDEDIEIGQWINPDIDTIWNIYPSLTPANPDDPSNVSQETETYPVTGPQNVPLQVSTVTTTTVDGYASGTNLDEGVTVTTAEQLITTCNSDEGPSGTVYGELQTSMKKSSKNSITIKWKKLSGTYYIVYGSECGSNKYQKLASVIGTSFTHRNLKKGKYYKYIVLAVHGDEVVSASKAVHIATKGGKAGNTKSIKLNKKKVGLKVGKTFKIKAKQKTVTKNTVVKKHRALSYESSDEDVATVSSKGVIKAVGKGITYIYVYAQDGVVAKIKVVVK